VENGHDAGRATAPERTAGWIRAYPLAWLPYAALYFGAFKTSGLATDLAARNAVAGILPAALLGLLILRVPRRLPWPEAGRGRARFFAAQAAVLLAFLLAALGLWAALVTLDSVVFDGTPRWSFDARVIPWHVLTDLLAYGALAAGAYAWHYADAHRRQAALAARAEALRARAELEVLRSQLNPHFILNTFHALLGLVRRDPEAAEHALERLGDLLRHTLRIQREGVDEVTLREEWAFVSAYLELERLRLGDRLRVGFDAEPGALELPVPAFALQTLVENAVRHAIAPRAAGGRVAVSARRRDGGLRIEVEDDGAEAIAAAGSGLPASPVAASDGQGIGLRLLRDRLTAMHAGRAGLEIRRTAAGTRAVLELPVHGEERE
jgi:signal transduction histidine kinase